MVENVIQVKKGITINVHASGKNIICVKKIKFVIVLMSCYNGKYLASITDD